MTNVDSSQNRLSEKSLKYGIWDGSAYAAMLGLTQDYLVPFALALKATVFQIGLLSSIPNLSMALSQLGAPRLAEMAGGRKRFILPVVFLHALLWLPILLIPYLFPGEKIWWLIGFLTLSTVLGSLGNPAWGSLMADLVPEGRRGKYFGFRGKISGLVTLGFFFIAGAVLHFSAANIMLGFSLLFGGALVFRLFSWHFLSRMHEPPLPDKKREPLRVLDIFRKPASSNLGRFISSVAMMNFVTTIASPFFAVYMLNELKFSYPTYVIVIASSTIASFTFMTFWGRRADRAGNIKVLKITAAFIPFVPLLWLGGHHLYYLLLIQVISGFAWSGFNLASSNFLYDASPPEHRMRHIAIFNAVNAGALCVGALLGGFLAPYLPPVKGSHLLTLFLISGVLRALVAATLFRHISEVRRVPEIATQELLFGKFHLVHMSGIGEQEPVLSPFPPLETERVPVKVPAPPFFKRELPAPERDHPH